MYQISTNQIIKSQISESVVSKCLKIQYLPAPNDILLLNFQALWKKQKKSSTFHRSHVLRVGRLAIWVELECRKNVYFSPDSPDAVLIFSPPKACNSFKSTYGGKKWFLKPSILGRKITLPARTTTPREGEWNGKHSDQRSASRKCI